MSIYRKPSKWADGEFPDERILSIALHQKIFTADKYKPRDKNRNKRARALADNGFLEYMGVNGPYRSYVITELGKEKLKELREVSK